MFLTYILLKGWIEKIPYLNHFPLILYKDSIFLGFELHILFQCYDLKEFSDYSRVSELDNRKEMVATFTKFVSALTCI